MTLFLSSVTLFLRFAPSAPFGRAYLCYDIHKIMDIIEKTGEKYARN